MRSIDLDHTSALLLELLDIPSPTGMTDAAVRRVESELRALGITPRRSKKGALGWEIPGHGGHGNGGQHVTFSGHLDTLGAMVRAVKPSGRLGLWPIGGFDWATIEGEEVRVHTAGGRVLSGTVVNTLQSTHVHGPRLRGLSREQVHMEVRLDERVGSAADVRALGTEVGDFVSFAHRPQRTASGYLKSRHLDNKASVAIMLAVTRELLARPALHTAAFHCTTYEEVGHGAATGIPPHTDALIVLDMAAVGEGQNSSEHAVSLCVADASGPYDHALGGRLRAAARAAGLELRPDIYPFYGSDGSAAWRAGGDYPVALIGPGVDASHAYERTHLDALAATGGLVLAYLDGAGLDGAASGGAVLDGAGGN